MVAAAMDDPEGNEKNSARHPKHDRRIAQRIRVQRRRPSPNIFLPASQADRRGFGAMTPGRGEDFCKFGWVERRPALAQAVMAPLICWSFGNSVFR
jgi:hypothetical protein